MRPRGSRTGEDGPHAATRSPPTGKFRDETGDRLTPSHTARLGRRLRYDVSNRLLRGRAGTTDKDTCGWRLPAQAFEQAVARIIADHFEAQAANQSLLARPDARNALQIGAPTEALLRHQHPSTRCNAPADPRQGASLG